MTEKVHDENDHEGKSPICGLVMPISALDGCNEQHWLDVRDILFEVIRYAGFEPNLVSNADDVGIIQKRIIQNLYANPIVVCDVSGKNPNVMFELGMRLAFDKPTIIVKDDKTSYSFDTSPIEHLEYPRDLRFNRIVGFKNALQEKIKGTLKKAQEDSGYTTFLKNFGKFTVAKLDTQEVPKDQFIIEEIGELRRQMQYLISRSRPLVQQHTLFEEDERRRRITHDHNSAECKHKISEAVKVVQDLLREEGASRRKQMSPGAIINKARDLNILPECFDRDRDPCRDVLENTLRAFREEPTGQTD